MIRIRLAISVRSYHLNYVIYSILWLFNGSKYLAFELSVRAD